MSWRLAFRLAHREVRRRPGRTALVVLLVAVPICGMTLATALVRTDIRTEEEEFLDANGDVDAVLASPGFDDVTYVPTTGGTHTATESGSERRPEPELPDLPTGSRTHTVRAARALVTGPAAGEGARGRVRTTPVVDRPLQGTFAGPLTLVDGAAPEADGEIALSQSFAADIGAEVGDEVEIATDHTATAFSGEPAQDPGEPTTATVVGLVEHRTCLGCLTTVIAPGAAMPEGADVPVQHLVKLPTGFDDPEELATLSGSGVVLRPDLVTGLRGPDDHYRSWDEDEATPVRWTLVLGAVALTAVGIVIAAAFAVGARRQLATLGQLSATGATPRLLQRVLALQGTVTGALGVGGGWVLAAVILTLGRARIETWVGHRLPGWEIRPPDMLGIAAVGVVAASVAALVPARSAARIPTLAALAGRRPQAPLPRRLPLAGLAAVLAGLALLGLAVLGAGSDNDTNGNIWAATAVTGGVLQLIGACGIAPVVAGHLEALGDRSRGATRLAARSLGRHRARTGAVVAAVAVAAALAVFSSALVQSFAERDRADDARYDGVNLAEDVVIARQGGHPRHGAFEDGMALSRPPGDVLEADLSSILPDAETGSISQGVLPETPWEIVAADPLLDERFGALLGPDWTVTGPTAPPVVVDDTLLATFDDTSDLEEALVGDGLLLLLPDLQVAQVEEAGDTPDPTATVRAPDGSEHETTARTVRLPWQITETIGEPALLVTPATAEELNLETAPVATVFDLPRPTSRTQRDDLTIMNQLAGGNAFPSDHTTGAAGAEPERTFTASPGAPSSGRTNPQTIELLLSGVAVAVALFVVATSLALAAAEGREERETLTVVGARPRALAGAAGAKALLLAGLGGLLALPLGLAPAVVVIRSISTDTDTYLGRDLGFAPPWLTILVLVVGLPLLAALVSGVGSALAQRLRPLRVSTATFE